MKLEVQLHAIHVCGAIVPLSLEEKLLRIDAMGQRIDRGVTFI
jgi:hypothetical protein